MRNIAFIFARGGSKGLPGKNVKLLANKPLIAHSIETALSVPAIETVFVSTDDEEIARVSAQYGAKVIARPPELAQDDSPEWLAWRHAIQWTTENHGEFEGFISLPATSPLRNCTDVEAAILKRQNTGADICISITPSSRNPYFNMVTATPTGEVSLVITPGESVHHRQDAPKVFDITTVVYATTSRFVMGQYGIFSGKVVAIEVPKERAVDIDDIYDFRMAEAILNERRAP